MDHESLRTASTYLNNLLLARGLLRNGEPIDFVKPSRDSRAQIINLVHDLILSADRDREKQENVAIALRNLRGDDARKSADLEKLREKSELDARNAIQARAAQKTAEAEAKKLERSLKSLQDQAARLKASLAQVKAQTQNDIRKRDLELARLKTHLQAQQRGNHRGPITAPSITISGGGQRGRPESRHEVSDPEYSLRQETTEFLTQLSQSLSDENDGLISMVRGALATMHELLGLPNKHPDSAIGSMHSNEDGKLSAGDMVQASPTSYDALAADMETCLEHLKGVLSNPNFVTIEEVEVREEEIARLREGWEKMESRWKDVLIMMEGWRRRMDTGDTINIDDLRRGMGLVSPVHRAVDSHQENPDQSLTNDMSISEIHDFDHVEDPQYSLTRQVTQGSNNSSPAKRKRDLLEPPISFDLRPTSSSHNNSSKSKLQSPSRIPVPPDLDDDDDGEDGDPYADHSPVMSIAEKLQQAEREAEEAAAAQRARPVPSSPSKQSGVANLDGAHDAEADDTLGKLPAVSPMAKKTKIRGRPRRRKSTLSPEELEALIGAAGEDE
ncbi:NIMA interactive protein [Teratosphaeria destructans]|uniref:NIMA interactive protein n=1 Tax=Teratosphaeria destructans TaxID=418781 RepID=A0A9W7SPE4_9PEZI|nr:NIMA interactive protein [Teratosphaeria destructans]